MKAKKLLVLPLLLVLLVSVSAVVPRLLTVQGRLKEAGSAVSGDYDITFYIYNQETGGSPLYTEAHTGANAVPVSAGFFSVVLGEITVLDLPFKEQYWLALKVGSDAEMTPRIKLTNSSYAFVARDLNVGANLNIDSGTLYVDIANNRVGVGTISPTGDLHVRNSTGAVGINLQAADDSAAGIYFYDDTNAEWHIEKNADNSFRIVETGVNPRIVILQGGNVGIGTTGPGAKLHVRDSSATNVEISRFDSAGGSGSIQGKTYMGLHHWSSGTYPSVRIGVEEDGTASYDASLVFQTRNSGSDVVPSTRMVIDKDGNVGIGTTSPAAKLHAVQAGGNVDPSLTYGSASAYIFNTASADLAMGVLTASPWSYWLQARASTNVALPISLNPLGGNVGIGTTSPGAKLEVVGDVKTSGTFWLTRDNFYRLTSWMNCVARARDAGYTIALITWPKDGQDHTCDSLCSTAVGPNGTTGYVCIGGGYFGYSPTQNTSTQGSIGERVNWGSCTTTFGPGSSYGFNSSMGYYMTGENGTGSGHVCCCGV